MGQKLSIYQGHGPSPPRRRSIFNRHLLHRKQGDPRPYPAGVVLAGGDLETLVEAPESGLLSAAISQERAWRGVLSAPSAMTILFHILKSKPDQTVYTIAPTSLVFDAVKLMAAKNIRARHYDDLGNVCAS